MDTCVTELISKHFSLYHIFVPHLLLISFLTYCVTYAHFDCREYKTWWPYSRVFCWPKLTYIYIYIHTHGLDLSFV